MKRRLHVYLCQKQQRVGTLYHDQQGARESVAFEYTRQWLETIDRFALDDFSRVGALRFQDETGEFCRAEDASGRRAPPFLALKALQAASHALERHTETAAELAFLRGHATSLGAMRPKCTVLDDAGKLWIGKFSSCSDERAVTKGEILTMQLAVKAGIRAAKTMLLDCDGAAVALVQRFDRDDAGERHMYVSAATLLGAETRDGQEHTYTEIADAIRQHSEQPRVDLHELWRRVAFSILVTNVDDHLHNHGFLHTQGANWRLAPAFDINPFPDRTRELKTWISEDSGPVASIDALFAVAPHFALSQRAARDILQEVHSAIDGWRAHGRSLQMTSGDLDAFAEAFEHRERRVGRAGT